MAMNTVPQYRDSNGKLKDVNGTNGYINVSSLGGSITHIREHITLAGTAATFDWSATPIRAVAITVTSEAQGTAQLPESVAVCIDPPNDTVRDAWLAAATSLAADTNRIVIPINTTLELAFTSDISYIGLVRDSGTGAVRVQAVGVEA